MSRYDLSALLDKLFPELPERPVSPWTDPRVQSPYEDRHGRTLDPIALAHEVLARLGHKPKPTPAISTSPTVERKEMAA